MGSSNKWFAGPTLGAIVLGALALTACEGTGDGQGGYPYGGGEKGNPEYYDSYETYEKNRSSIFGSDGLSLGGPDKPRDEGGGGGIGVNSFLWRASLDTISFMPVNSADPFGGVIITDWHSDAQAPAERFKLNVYIMGRALRADGVRVAVFRQVQDTRGTWRDSPLPDNTSTDVENAILTKARQLRNKSFQR